MAAAETSGKSLDQLPAALLCTIITKLDVASISSVAATCSTFRACAAQILSFLTSFHLLVSCLFMPFQLLVIKVLSFFLLNLIVGVFFFLLMNEACVRKPQRFI